MRSKLLLVLLAAAASAALLAAQTRTTLDIYVVDVEGGNATLFVAPSGESVLIDTGNGGIRCSYGRAAIAHALFSAGCERAVAQLSASTGLAEIVRDPFSVG